MTQKYHAIVSSDWNECLAPCGPFDYIAFTYPELAPALDDIFKRYTGNHLTFKAAMQRAAALQPKPVTAAQMDAYLEKARQSMVKVAIVEPGTIPHEQIGRCGAARVVMRPASKGTGVIAGGPVRALVEVAGISNILTKAVGTNNPQNVVKAAFDALRRLQTKEQVARRRGKSPDEI